ncbi:hypothetical protein BRC62_00460, partial [Halobacteriales archaeon QH_10_67_13]
MIRSRQGTVAVVLILVLAGGLVAVAEPATGVSPQVTDERTSLASALTEQAQASSTETIDLTRELGLVPNVPGTYAATYEYRLPDRLESLEVTLPAEAAVQSRIGFEAVDDRTYAWDGETDGPRLRYRLPANETVSPDGPIAAPGSLLFADTGDWAVVRQPRDGHEWSWRGEDVRVVLDRTTTARQGAVGDQTAYLGPYDRYTNDSHGQRFELVVPEAATLEEAPTDIFASLGAAADRLRVGDRDEQVLAIAAPTQGVEWGVRGLQTGESDMWVRDVEPLADPDNVWIHEYVHTRQDYDLAANLQWFTEASATYYAALATFEQDRISFERFRDLLARGERSIHADSVLADPDSWQRNANYHVGALVSGELDRRLRVATDRERSLQTVLSRLNAASETVSAARFRSIVADAAGETVKERTVTGPYRNRTLSTAEPTLVPGETISLEALVANAGGTAGEYEAVVAVDGQPRETRTGVLDPDESTAINVTERFDAPGVYNLSVGGATVPVEVREPATPTITTASTNRTRLAAGGAVTVTVGLTNEAAYPGEREVTLTRDGDAIGTETVHADAGARTEVSFETQVDRPGEYTLA